ncbi:MAG: Fur family transcriptional regulator [Rothia sp. (in: high G+C Gram-positive bacteria)]|nr:Fur family transcriptional regulator [Rothia sp. (in: high G+C Gram-positive bacteria)]
MVDTNIPIRKIVKHATARNTRQRRLIKSTMAELGDFISAQDLHLNLAQRQESISLATTYRVLQSLATSGELDMVKGIEGETLYRHCQATTHHHHLICRRCGKAVELEAPALEEWATEMGEKYGYSDLSHMLEVTGHCPECTAYLRENEPQITYEYQ